MLPRAVALLGTLALCVVLLAPGASAAPEQVHLSQLPSGIVVQWALAGDTRELPPGRVEFGPTAQHGSSVDAELVAFVDGSPYVGTSSSGVLRDLQEAPATIYRALLPAMPAGALFHYRILDGRGEASADLVGRTLPGPHAPTRIVAFGDQGTTEDGTALFPDHAPNEVTALALAQRPNVTLVSGDLAYQEEGAMRWWNQWFEIVEPLASTAPFYAAIGNHDRDFVSGYEHWRSRFSFPGDERTYSFDAGPVHVLVLNSQDACLEATTMETVQRVNLGCQATTASGAPTGNPEILALLHADLADAQARGVPWTLVMFHHPPYSHGAYNETDSGDDFMFWMRANWVPLFERYGVDLVVTGHDHDYQRTWPLLSGAPTRAGASYMEGEGIVYLVTGGGGRPPYPLSPPPMPAWFATGASLHHVLVIDATAERLDVRAVALDGGVIDAFEVVAAPQHAAFSLHAVTGALAFVGIAVGLRRAPLSVLTGR